MPRSSPKPRAASSPKPKAPKSKPFVRAKHAGKLAPKVNTKTGDKTYAVRGDLNKPGIVAIERLPEPHRSVALAAHKVIMKLVPGAESVVKWGNACYYLDGKGFASLYQTKAGVNLALPGASLPDPEGLLEGTGKSMRHVKLRDPAQAKSPAVAALIRAGLKIGFEKM